MKVENAKCSLLKVQRETQMPEWTKTVKLNGKVVKALLDTGCTKTIVHPRCVMEEDYLGWSIPYNTASKRKTHFPAASVTLEIEGKTTTIAVGVSKHCSVSCNLHTYPLPNIEDLIANIGSSKFITTLD